MCQAKPGRRCAKGVARAEKAADVRLQKSKEGYNKALDALNEAKKGGDKKDIAKKQQAFNIAEENFQKAANIHSILVSEKLETEEGLRKSRGVIANAHPENAERLRGAFTRVYMNSNARLVAGRAARIASAQKKKVALGESKGFEYEYDASEKGVVSVKRSRLSKENGVVVRAGSVATYVDNGRGVNMGVTESVSSGYVEDHNKREAALAIIDKESVTPKIDVNGKKFPIRVNISRPDFALNDKSSVIVEGWKGNDTERLAATTALEESGFESVVFVEKRD